MSAEFEELMKARDNPSEEAQSKSKTRRSCFCLHPRFSTVVYTSTGLVCECCDTFVSLQTWWSSLMKRDTAVTSTSTTVT